MISNVTDISWKLLALAGLILPNTRLLVAFGSLSFVVVQLADTIFLLQDAISGVRSKQGYPSWLIWLNSLPDLQMMNRAVKERLMISGFLWLTLWLTGWWFRYIYIFLSFETSSLINFQAWLICFLTGASDARVWLTFRFLTWGMAASTFISGYHNGGSITKWAGQFSTTMVFNIIFMGILVWAILSQSFPNLFIGEQKG